jgi:uncharacterized membrane protein YozB (DUF420 family)
VIFILNYYVISIFKFYDIFKILNSIKSIYCVNLISHIIKFQIEKLMTLIWLWADDKHVAEN